MASQMAEILSQSEIGTASTSKWNYWGRNHIDQLKDCIQSQNYVEKNQKTDFFMVMFACYNLFLSFCHHCPWETEIKDVILDLFITTKTQSFILLWMQGPLIKLSSIFFFFWSSINYTHEDICVYLANLFKLPKILILISCGNKVHSSWHSIGG